MDSDAKLIEWFFMSCPACGWFGNFTKRMIMSACPRCIEYNKTHPRRTKVGQLRYHYPPTHYSKDATWKEEWGQQALPIK